MQSKHSKLAPMLMALALLLALAVGPVAPASAVDVGDGLHGLLANPHAGGGGGTGGV
jgi:hypothetical protein